MQKSKRDKYVLSSGREIYANCHIIGINPKLEIHHGYDGEIFLQKLHEDDVEWTDNEKKELAQYMIGLWNCFAEGKEPEE